MWPFSPGQLKSFTQVTTATHARACTHTLISTHLTDGTVLAASPKSATTAVYLEPNLRRSTLCELRSLCSILFLWRYSMPLATSKERWILRAHGSSSELLMRSSSVPPLMYCHSGSCFNVDCCCSCNANIHKYMFMLIM